MHEQILADREFIIFAISLITHGKDLNSSLDLLLNRLAKHYKLDMVALFEFDDREPTMRLTNYYCETMELYEHTTFPRSLPEMEEMAPGECRILHVPDPAGAANGLYHKADGAQDALTSYCVVVGKFEFFEWHGVVYYACFDDEHTWSEEELTVFGELTGVISVFVSLRSSHNDRESEIYQLKQCDQLTGLYNQVEFRGQLRAALPKLDPEKTYAIVSVDLNNFGYVNENYGYQVGDSVLQSYAKRVSGHVPFIMGCRLYSDFFLFLMVHENEDEMMKFLNEGAARFSNMINHKYPGSGMSVATGVYFLEPGAELEAAIENAHLARKRSKALRIGGAMRFYPEMRKKRSEEQQVIGEFEEALDRGDFCMYLQPKFTLGDHRIYGAEALARWKKPDGTLLPPAVFIEPLERIGYIIELDFYIYEEVLKTMTRWQERKLPMITVSTNFSGRHFEQDSERFLKRIIHILHKYTIPAKYIEIEITEGVLIRNQANLRECLASLRDYGFRIAIDDFGTGYSSLSVLMDVPSDVIKMDRAFINRKQDERSRKILTEMRQFIRIAEKETIFEGIETQEQESLLLDCGYTCGQGYLCSKPVNISEFELKYLSQV